MELRLEVGEIVVHLKETAGNWDGLMPPHIRVVAQDEKETLGSKGHSEFGILIFP